MVLGVSFESLMKLGKILSGSFHKDFYQGTFFVKEKILSVLVYFAKSLVTLLYIAIEFDKIHYSQ